MGTNYYALIDVCEHCGRPKEKLHIGKSSWGWCFGLHVIPENGLNALDDWLELLKQDNCKIFNEYGELVSFQDLLAIITERGHGFCAPSVASRHTIDGRFCIGYGEGTWDYLAGEFS